MDVCSSSLEGISWLVAERAVWVTVEDHVQAWSFSGCEQCLVFISLTCGGSEAARPAVTWGYYGFVLIVASFSACHTDFLPATWWVFMSFVVRCVYSWYVISFSIEKQSWLVVWWHDCDWYRSIGVFKAFLKKSYFCQHVWDFHTWLSVQ